MGLKETIQGLAQTAITAVGNLKFSATYTVKGAPTYNTATGQVTSNDTVYTAVPGVFDDMAYLNLGKINVPNIKVDQNERLFYIAQLDLTPTPKNGDELTVLGETWEIIEIKTDPAEALWILKGKKP